MPNATISVAAVAGSSPREDRPLTPVRHHSTILFAASILAGSWKPNSSSPQDLATLLRSRLVQYHTALGDFNSFVESQLEKIDPQFETANQALWIAERIQKEELAHLIEGSSTPLLGARDISHLRTLLSIVFKWAVEPADTKTLSTLLSHISALVFCEGGETTVGTMLLQRHPTDLLKSFILLECDDHSFRSHTTRLLRMIPLPQTITSLGMILSDPKTPAVARKLIGTYLSQQLLLPDGVQALCIAVFGDEDTRTTVQLEKLERVARVLSSAPGSMDRKEYYNLIIPRIINLLSSSSALPAYKRAAAFTLSRMLSPTSPSHLQATPIILSILHSPFSDLDSDRGPSAALYNLSAFLTHTDPSPTLPSTILGPIIPHLYTLAAHLSSTATSDPTLKSLAENLVLTWGKVVNEDEAVRELWRIVRGEGGDWKGANEDTLKWLPTHEIPEQLKLLTPADNLDDISSNILDLRPDPAHFVGVIKSLDRKDVSSSLFLRLLDSYRTLRLEIHEDPMQSLLTLQLLHEMQSRLGTSILQKPEHVFTFISHALESVPSAVTPDQSNPHQKGGVDLKIVPDVDEINRFEDSDDEDAPAADGVPDEMVVTALDLLLALLESNPELSPSSTPLLNHILTQVDLLTTHPSESLQQLSREARLVLTARKSLSSSTPRDQRAGSKGPLETYQEALRLLQDPILPVRAHGLLLLRNLVSSPSEEINALIPAILDIFLQSIQDEDSYIYLNAVYGLSALVESFGKQTFIGLVDIYTREQDGIGEMKKVELDRRVRVGEALVLIVKRRGEAFVIYSDILIPPLFHILRSQHLPTALRTSCIAILSQCVETSPLSMIRYYDELVATLLDLLQVERGNVSPKEPEETSKERMDQIPTSTNSKLPPFRRSAIHFLSILVKFSVRNIYDRSSTSSVNPLHPPNRRLHLSEPAFFPPSLIDRATIIVGYIASTDVDTIVRVMAGECVELLKELKKARVEVSSVG